MKKANNKKAVAPAARTAATKPARKRLPRVKKDNTPPPAETPQEEAPQPATTPQAELFAPELPPPPPAAPSPAHQKLWDYVNTLLSAANHAPVKVCIARLLDAADDTIKQLQAPGLEISAKSRESYTLWATFTAEHFKP